MKVARNVFGVLLVAAIVTLVILGLWTERQYWEEAYEVRKDIIIKTFPTMPPDSVDFCARHMTSADVARAVWIQHGHIKVD